MIDRFEAVNEEMICSEQLLSYIYTYTLSFLGEDLMMSRASSYRQHD